MPNIVFDPDTHTYEVDGEKYPSVTEILSVLSYKTYGNIDKATLEYASRRGTDIHEATEAVDMGGEAEVDGETEPYVHAYMDFVRDYNPNWFGIEEIVANTDQHYAGTVDRHGYFGSKPVVLDIKTIGSPGRLDYTKVCLQTYLYSICLDYDNPMLFALFLRKSGTYRLFDCRAWWAENHYEPLHMGARDILAVHKTINYLKGESK